ncbi:MAG: hypothetical protein M3N12_03340 [Verrucomicrobiota bacterium]|nr:hypothetical protein [Verrucomicrobiota bacterium]
MIARATVKVILPLACAWVRRQEALILGTGVALSTAQLADARRIGVEHPERVRLKFVDRVPLPLSLLRKVAGKFLAFPTDPIGITLGYGIFIRSQYANDRRLLLHELAHTLQYERFGGIRPFLAQYLQECLTTGYAFASLEDEARRRSEAIASSPESSLDTETRDPHL